MHPFATLGRGSLRFYSTILLTSWGLLTPILIWAAPGRSDFTIPDLAIAGSVPAAREILSHWSASDRTAFAFILGFDLLYDLVHNNAVALCATWAVVGCSARLIRSASVIAWLLWIASAANFLENLAFFHMLQTSPESPWPEIGFGTTLFRNGALAGCGESLSNDRSAFV